MDVTKIRYRDLAIRERDERQRLRNRLNQIDRTARSRLGGGGAVIDDASEPVYLSEDERKERALILAILDAIKQRPREWCDPLFVAARDLFNAKPGILAAYMLNPSGDIDGEMPGVSLRFVPEESSSAAERARRAADAALTLGLLIVDLAEPPPVRIDPTDIRSAAVGLTDSVNPPELDRDPFAINANRDDKAWAGMNRSFFAAVGEAQSVSNLAGRVLVILAIEGGRYAVTDDTKDGDAIVDLKEFALVMRELVKKGYDENTPQLSRKVTEALDKVQGVGQDDVVSEMGIDLPDLEDQAANEIVAENVRLMGPVICAAMMEELKAFQVVDRLVEMAQAGTLPIVGRGNAGRMLYKRWKEAPNRISEQERHSLYAMTMGQPGGDPSGSVNREFDDLWIRFVSSVSSFVRQSEVDKLLRASLPSAIGQQQVRKAARDLAANLSLHGYGLTYFTALDLQGDLKSMIDLLSDEEIRGAFGAKDMWQVIDQVATMELGGARTSSRYRTLATCGAIITAWLAKNVDKIMRPAGTVPLIDLAEVRSPSPRTAGRKATSDPSDYDLVNACELWLADTATSDTRIEEMSQPRETPVMTSKPVQIPSFAREFLDDLPGMGLGKSNGVGARGARH